MFNPGPRLGKTNGGAIGRGDFVDSYLQSFRAVEGSPWGWESQSGLRMIPVERRDAADVNDLTNIPTIFAQSLGTAGKVGSNSQISSNRFTLPPGIHKKFTLVIGLNKQAHNNVLFNSGYTLLESYTYTADDQQVIYRLSGPELHNLMYGLSYKGTESERMMSRIMYQGFTHAAFYTPPMVGSTAEVDFDLNPLCLSAVSLYLDLPTPWHGPDIIGMDDFNDGLIETSKPIYHTIDIVVADYSRSFSIDAADQAIIDDATIGVTAGQVMSDRTKIGPMTFQLWDYYYPKSNATAQKMSEVELNQCPLVPSYNLQRVRETKVVEGHTVAEISTELQKYAGRTFALLFWVSDTFLQVYKQNYVTRYLEMGEVELDIANYSAAVYRSPQKEFLEVVANATGGRAAAGIVEEHIGIIPFNPTLNVKIYGGALDTMVDNPILRVTVKNKASTQRTLEQTTFLMQYAYYTRSGVNDSFEFVGQ